MKIKDTESTLSEKSANGVKSNATIEKKKNKKKGNFEVRIPRIIVRNLNFKVKEDQLKKAFEKCSTAISNISIVSRDGQSKGFGFVTFEKLEDAQKAIQTMNGQKILGRPMAVDWSLPKNVYEKMQTKEPSRLVQNDSYGIQSNSKPKGVKEKVEEMEVEEEEEPEDSLDEEDEEEEEDEDKTQKTRTDESSRDVREHRTIFVRNVPFDATKEELTNVLSSNGQRRIVSCHLVIDPISRHPRGTAFVQFALTNDAEECLNSSFSLQGQDLHLDMALGRGELVQAKEVRDKKNEDKHKQDQRNLFLSNHGVILNLEELDGNENDLRKRQQLEDAKKQKLKNPLYFISPTRLTVHNLPPHVDDQKLRQIVVDLLKENQIPMKDIVLNECRVMKKNKDAKKSLGYGFLNLSQHEIAVRVIKLLNNNKLVFGSNRRPIVQFSIENRQALNLQEQRRERVHAKQEFLKNPMDKTLSFEGNKTKKQQQQRNHFLEQNNKKTRLSDIIKQQQQQQQEEEKEVESSGFSNGNKKTSSNWNTENKTKKKIKRLKTKSKGEIRDKVDRMIALARNKPQLPQRTKEKWFE